MADLDAELLALAGDDSDEGETRQSTNTTKSESPNSIPKSPAVKGQNTASSGKAGSASMRVIKTATGARKGARNNKRGTSEEEEGEASSTPSSPNSLQSAPMSESSSGRSSPGGPIFPIENKFYSEEEKAKIMALPEISREGILTERAQVVDDELQKRHLRRLLRERERAEAKEDGQKRKVGAADLDDTQRKSSRQKIRPGGRKVGEASKPLEEYKRQREQRGIEIEQRKRDDGNIGDRRGRGSRDGSSDADAKGESDVEWDHKHRSGSSVSPPNRDQQPADLSDFNHTRVGRSNFAKYCFYPGFEQAIVNCFVRASVETDQATGVNVYRMAQIKRFTEGRPYAMEGPNGRMFVTNQYALLTIGKSEREFPFIHCSDLKLTQAELERYKKTLVAEQLPIATKPFLNSKVSDINGLINHRFTDQEITVKINRAKALLGKFNGEERNEILSRRKNAVSNQDQEEITKCDAELAALEPTPKLAFNTKLYESPKKGPRPLTQGEQLAIVNSNNRKANARDVREAQLKERKAQREAAAAVARGEAAPDPFARVKTRAKVFHDFYADKNTLDPAKTDDLFGSGSDRSRGSTPGPVGKIGSVKRSATLLPEVQAVPEIRPVREMRGSKEYGTWPIPALIPSWVEDAEFMRTLDIGIDPDEIMTLL